MAVQYLQCSKGRNSKCRLTRVMVLVFCTSSGNASHLCEISWKYLKRFFLFTKQTRVHGGNGYVQCSMGNNSKSRQTRVLLHMFCILPHGTLYLCEVLWIYLKQYQLLSGQKYMVEMAMFKGQELLKQTNQSYGSCVLHVVSWCFTFVCSFVKKSQTVSELWSRHKIMKRRRTDTQNFGRYNIIPRHFFWWGIKSDKKII